MTHHLRTAARPPYAGDTATRLRNAASRCKILRLTG
jgi:hypothetical protein